MKIKSLFMLVKLIYSVINDICLLIKSLTLYILYVYLKIIKGFLWQFLLEIFFKGHQPIFRG